MLLWLDNTVQTEIFPSIKSASLFKLSVYYRQMLIPTKLHLNKILNPQNSQITCATRIFYSQSKSLTPSGRFIMASIKCFFFFRLLTSWRSCPTWFLNHQFQSCIITIRDWNWWKKIFFGTSPPGRSSPATDPRWRRWGGTLRTTSAPTPSSSQRPDLFFEWL